MSKTPNYYIVEADALPRSSEKWWKPGACWTRGRPKRSTRRSSSRGSAAARFTNIGTRSGPSRIYAPWRIVTFQIMMKDEPGILSQVLNFFADSGANILTINQGLPINGCAVVTV